MVRGKTWFRCPNCGKIFKSWDIEDRSTVFSTPMPCPACGTESESAGPLGWIRQMMKKLTRQ